MGPPSTWLLPALAALLTTAGPAAARSSLTARVEAPVVGPGVEQTAVLILGFFPGDGEALLEVRGRVAPAQVQLLSASAGRGAATVADGDLRVDYRAAPIGERGADTVQVRLIALAAGASLALELYTNTAAEPAHRTATVLETAPPLAVDATLTPAVFYAGETVEAVVRVRNVDPDGRQVESLDVRWPAALEPVGQTVVESEAEPSVFELRQTLRVDAAATEDLDIAADVAGDGLRASPVALPPARVGTLPRFAVEAPAGGLRRGQAASLTLTWHNPGAAAMVLAALEAHAPAGLGRARLPAGPGGARLEADEEKGSVTVRVAGPIELAPGAAQTVVLEATPQLAGPLTVTGAARPQDRATPVRLAGADVVLVLDPETPEAAPTLARTDLELAVAGLEEPLRAALADLPLPQGAGVALLAERSDDGNWVAEGLLTDLLRQRGLRVLADSTAAVRLRYRLADARVVYSPAGRGWNLFGSARRRDARTEVYLRLVSDEQARWARRVAGVSAEARAPGAADWLGGARGIDQAQVEADHRALEFGLSGLIAGGLFFVFFAP